MKKIYMILGNKPFEEKLFEQLAHNFKPVGSADNVGEQTIADILTHGVDTLIIRESMADNETEFYEFLKRIRENNHALKVVAIVQQRPFGDNYLFNLAKIGVCDIINGGTRLSDVIEMSLRELSLQDVFPLLTIEQQAELERVASSNVVEANLNDLESEDDIIEINGELLVEEDNKLIGFKERYLSGITQVYAPIDENEEVNKPELPVLAPNDLLAPVTIDKPETEVPENPFGFHLPGQQAPRETTPVEPETLTVEEVKTEPESNVEEDEEMVLELSETMDARPRKATLPKSDTVVPNVVESAKEPVQTQSVTPQVEVKPLNTVTQLTLHLVDHSLMSSIAMQYAVVRAKTKQVAYVETDNRNQMFQATCEKKGVCYQWMDNKKMLKDIVNELSQKGVEEIVLNTRDASLLSALDFKNIYCEILQDKDRAVRIHEVLKDHPDGRMVVAYYEPDLVSIKALNKTYNRSSLKWVNTRVEEYNSRLNAKLLANEAVSEMAKEG